MWEESELTIEGIDMDQLALYLGKYLALEEVIEEGFEEIIYTKEVKAKKKRVVRKKVGKIHTKTKSKKKILKKVVMDKAINPSEGADTLNTNVDEENINDKADKPMDTGDKKKKRTNIWKKPTRKPTDIEEKKMFGKALELMLITCLDNHLYQFNNEVRIQSKGGPIGLRLTGEIADCMMIDWDKTLLAELEKVGITPGVYTRFKDDIQIVNEALEKGSRITEGKVEIDQDKKEIDNDKSDAKVTIEVIQKLANDINPMIQLTVETPCNFDDGKLPVLDVKVDINVEANYRIDFEFFEKPTRNPKVILMDSALSFPQKRTILTQECLRRLRNTNVDLGPEIQKKHLDQFMLKLKNSNYNEKFRTQVLDSALKAFKKMQEDDKNGTKPMYRNRSWNAEERKSKKNEKKLNWWNSKKSKIHYTSVLFVTPTPGGTLARELRQREEELNRHSQERVKIVEKGGLKIKDILGTKKTFKNSKCTQKNCPMCTTSSLVVCSEANKIPCNTHNVGYRWQCCTCEERDQTRIYEGETGRSARVRGLEHVKEFEKKKKNSVLYKHAKREHKNEKVQFKMEITKKFRDALSRQANEAVRIFNRSTDQLLNSKAEFNHPPLARVVVEKKINLGCDKKRKYSTNS